MYKSIFIILSTLLVSCSSSKPQLDVKEQLYQYTGANYITFTFFPKNNHSITMSGIGETFEIKQLKRDNIENFVESFYEQLVYSPLFDLLENYKESMGCLGYEEKWYDIYNAAEITSSINEIYKLKLNDGNYVNINISRLLEELDVIYIDGYEECIMSSSIELDINKIKSINKVAILLDKE